MTDEQFDILREIGGAQLALLQRICASVEAVTQAQFGATKRNGVDWAEIQALLAQARLNI